MKPSFVRVLGVAVAMAAVLAPSAAAHAYLVRSAPADRAVVKSAPPQVRFTFDQPVEPAPGIAAIRNGGGSVLGGKPRVSGRHLIVPLKPALGDGVYSVRWQVISADGHETGGVIAFAVGAGNPVAALSATSSGPGPLIVITRWLWFLGLLAAAGIAVFHVVVWRPTAAEEDRGGAGLDGSERREGSLVLALCFVLALAGALGLLALSQDVEATRFGRVLIAGAAVAGVGAAAALFSLVTRFARPVALLAAVAMLPLPTLAGHALDPGRSRLDVVVDVAHVTAAGVWLGGLISLLLIAPRAAAVLGDSRARLLQPLAVRFSSLALAAVALLVASGIWRAVVELSAFSQLWTTGYGRAILVKSTLLLFTVGLAARNRYLFLAGPFSKLRLGVLGESVLLLGVVVAVAFLTDLPPGRLAAEAKASTPAAPPAVAKAGPPALPPPGALVQAQEDGRLAVALAAQPASGRRLRLTATVIGPDANGANGLPVTLDGVRAVACGSGCYRAVVPRRGTARVVVSGKAVAFDIPASWPSAEQMVRRATTRFRHLRSVAYVERLSSGPGIHLLSHFRLQAPNKLSYAIRGGSDGIVIGKRRWDRSAGGRWRESTTGPLPQPTPIWGLHPQDARLVGKTKRVAVVSFIDRSLPAWFTVRLDRRTLHPISLTMTAAAHFMSHRYTAFNDVPKIRPPTGRGASR